jgi:hypothetical protein
MMNLGASDMLTKDANSFKIVVKGNVTREPVNLDVSPDELIENVKKMVLDKLPHLYRLDFEGVELGLL